MIAAIGFLFLMVGVCCVSIFLNPNSTAAEKYRAELESKYLIF